METRTIRANGIDLHVRVGSPNGEPVLFLHFGQGSSAVWAGVLPHFLLSYQVIALDLRGHGRSAKPETGYTLETMAQDVIGVMDALSVDQAHLVGASMGAEVAACLAAMAPLKVRSLALEGALQNAFGPHGRYDVPPEQVEAKKEELRRQRAARPPLAATTPEAVLVKLLARWERLTIDDPFAQVMRHLIEQRDDGLYDLNCPPRVVDQYLENHWETRLDRFYERINAPVLFLPSTVEQADPRSQSSLTWMRSKLRHSAVAVISGARHATVVLDQPDRFAQAVLQFQRHANVLF